MRNCAQTRDALTDLLYGELPPAVAQAVQEHLAGCAPCRAEFAALRQVRATLDAAPVPVPRAEVDLPRLYREAARRQTQRLRRWRRLAAASLAAAAVLLIAFGLNLEVRLEQHQVVLRWGKPPQADAPRPTPPPPDAVRPGAADRDAEMQLVKDLIHLMAADVQDRDRQQKEALRALRQGFEALRVQTEERCAATERDVTALYTVQFGPRNKGEKP
jgi:hypothetical protein